VKLAELMELRRPQFERMGGQTILNIPVLPQDKSIEPDPNYVIYFPIGKDGLPLRRGTVVYTAPGLGEISLAARKHAWRQAYAVCSNVKEKVASSPT